MICKKCEGQGVITTVGQRVDTEAAVGLALLTMGASLLLTTCPKEKRCPRCQGTGRVGY
jgi:hypothetical protein